jgi:hypothetical protein
MTTPTDHGFTPVAHDRWIRPGEVLTRATYAGRTTWHLRTRAGRYESRPGEGLAEFLGRVLWAEGAR